jgi:hypothetical protein
MSSNILHHLGPPPKQTKPERQCEHGEKTKSRKLTSDMRVRKTPGNVPHPILETRTTKILAIHERLAREGEGHVQPEPKEQNQGSEDAGCAAVRFDPFVEIDFESKTGRRWRRLPGIP